jgi:multidrug transporter EmrE-like cation transporter
MNYPFYDVIGNLGVVMIVGSYLLVQIRKMSSMELPYAVVNGLGAAFILYSLYFEFNLSAFMVEVFWLLISLVGMVRIYLERSRQTTP